MRITMSENFFMRREAKNDAKNPIIFFEMSRKNGTNFERPRKERE